MVKLNTGIKLAKNTSIDGISKGFIELNRYKQMLLWLMIGVEQNKKKLCRISHSSEKLKPNKFKSMKLAGIYIFFSLPIACECINIIIQCGRNVTCCSKHRTMDRASLLLRMSHLPLQTNWFSIFFVVLLVLFDGFELSILSLCHIH